MSDSQIKIKNFASTLEAEMAKNALKARGIKSLIQNTGVHSSGVANDRNGADLYVWEKDADEAKALLGI